MPILDTVVLFGTADSRDGQHERAKRHLQRVSEVGTYLGTFALMEFDIVMKSRGLTVDDRMVKQRFRELAKGGEFTILTKRPLQPGDEETARNPASRSARLRAVEMN